VEVFEVGGANSSITLMRKPQQVVGGIPIYAANDATLNLALDNGTSSGVTPAPTSSNETVGVLNNVAQVETATANGTISASGNAKVTVTAAAIGGSKTLLVPVLLNETSAQWATKVRAALGADLQVVEVFEVGGANSSITLMRKPQQVVGGIPIYAANDATLNLALDNDTATGIATATSSDNTTLGTLSSVAQVETATANGTISVTGDAKVVVTAAGLLGSPKTYRVAVTKDNTASTWLDYVKTALNADPNLTDLFEVVANGNSLTLTRKPQAVVSGKFIYAANDATLNVDLDNDTSKGITPQTLSASTTAGIIDNKAQVETATATGGVTANGSVDVVVTSAALVGSPKTIVVPVTLNETSAQWATKVRSALTSDLSVSGLFTVSGIDSKIILTRRADLVSPGLNLFADNDPTLNVAIISGSEGITPAVNSANTTAGALDSAAQVETATAVGTINSNGEVQVVVTAAGLPGSPKTIVVPVTAGDTTTQWATKVQAALTADADVSKLFAATLSGNSIKLTRKIEATVDGVPLYAANDATLNIALATEGQGGKGITPAVNSANTTAGALDSAAQVETSTAVGTINTNGEVQVVVTAAGLPGSPKTIVVPVTAGDTATQWATKVQAALTADADVSKLFAATLSGNSIKLTRKIEATVDGVPLYAANDATLNIALATEGQGGKGITPAVNSANTTAGALDSAAQVETSTAVGTINTNGEVQVVVTAAGLPGSPKTIVAPVTAGDTATQWATKVHAALATDADVSKLFAATLSGNSIKLTRKIEATVDGVPLYAANDATLNIALATEGQGSKGITPAVNSVNTTAGALDSAAQVETATAVGTINTNGEVQVVVTAAGLPGTPKTIVVPVTAGDTATQWATKVSAALTTDADVSKLFAATLSGNSIKLTRKVEATVDGVPLYAANDATLNIALATEGQSSQGITPAGNSANTTAGALDSSPQIETATADGAATANGSAQVVVTAAGLVGSPKTYIIPVVAGESASLWAGKVRTTLGLDADLSALFEVGGSASSITLKRKTQATFQGVTLYAANDPTLNISIGSGSKGITPSLTSINTRVGVLNGDAQVETAAAVGTITTNGNAEVVITADGLTGSPKTFAIPVALNDTSAVWAGKVRAALAADTAVSALFEVGGSSASIVLTRKVLATNDLRRNSSTGALTGAATLRTLPSAMTGDVAGYTQANEKGIEFSNYSRVGDKKYFYTVGTLMGTGALSGTSVISTYQITNTNPTLVNRAAPGITISSSAQVGTVNPADGSALIKDEDGDALIWLHTLAGYDAVTSSTTTGYSALPNSSQAKALFVTNEQAVIYENADAAKNANGTIPAAIVKHYARDTTTGVLTASPLALDGTTLLNTPRLTPVADYWLLTTVQKPKADTSTLRTYVLLTAQQIDSDGDGLMNAVETNTGIFVSDKNTGSDPFNADSDGDGLSDGEEVANGSNPNDPTSVSDHTLTLTNGGVATGGTFGKTSGSLAHGASATFTAVPAAGYVFQAWTGDLSGSTNPSILLMSGNKTVGATFASDTRDPDGDGLSNYDELVTYKTNPNKADTDGDGLRDGAEVNTYKTDPNQSDTDVDGLTDGAEVNTYKTSPFLTDTDGDGLSDKEEVDGTHGFKSSPLLWDTDSDLVSDIDEVNATPPTDPNDSSKYPNSGITRLSLLHALPVAASAPASVAIDESVASYGHRPDRDKVGDDGSSVIIDRNGVLIWTNKQGVAVTVPGASRAKTLYVSNTECVVYNNRFATTYNSRDEKAEVVIHRRGATGPVTSSKTIMMDGTVLDTCPVTPTTYGFTLATGRTYEDGAESTSVTLVIIAAGANVIQREQINSVDVWDTMSVDLKRITWDGEQHQLANTRFSVPNNTQNLESVVVQGHGSDGSVVFSAMEGIDFFARYDDASQGEFLPAVRSSFWGSLNLGQEKFDKLGEQFSNLASLTNDRAVLELEDPITGKYELQDWRQAANRSVSVAKTIQLPAGERMLPLSTYTIDGLPPYVYTIDTAGTSLRLYKADASLSAVGAAVTLPAKVKMPFSFVRNPRDGSLLIQSEDRGLMWIPTTTAADSPVITGLGTPQVLVNSVEAKPLFVAAKEAVAWLNGKATVINGSLPAAQISHYQFNDKNSLVVASSLTPPMEGKYVVLPNPLTPDPDLEGWYVTTFEKNAPASTLMRTYQLQVAGSTDRDQDGISDYDEMMVTFTDPGDPDTDGDGLLDGQEVRPYQIVTTALSWEAARLDAISKGGRLAVLDTQLKQDAFKAAMQFQKADGKYWIGGHDINDDVTVDGIFKWLDAKGLISGPGIIAPKNWDQYQPSNLNNADGMEVTSGSDYKWSMAQTSKLQGYVIEFAATDPKDDDSDNDGYKDGYELANLTNPKDVAAVPTYLLSLFNAGISTGGTFSMASGSLAHGTNATLTAAPATGYVLQAWTGDLLGSTLTKTLLMNGNKTVGATFVPDTHDSDGDGLSNYDELVTYHTDPNDADGDGDGLSDGAEINNIGSNPKDMNDVLRPSGLPFTNCKVAKGDYWGLVYDPAAGVLTSLKLTLAPKGSFSATMLGYPAFKGAFSAGVCNMAYSGADMASVSMTLQQMDGGWAMVGSFSDVMGKKLSFVLRRAIAYRKCNLTFAASPIDAATAPTGSAVATGAIAKGKVSFMVYLPNGGVQSFSGAVVGGNRIPLFTGGGGLAGELSLWSRPGSSDFDGKVNFRGYNQLRSLTGSFYVKRSKKDLPLNFGDKKNLPNNTLFQWSGGSFNGSQLVGTWTPKTLTLSTESSQQANATLNAKNGLMGVNYYNGSAWATGKAVVLQASNAAKGFYTNGPDWGSLVIEPNHNNILPAAGASLSGASYSGSKAAATVTVTVYAAGAWNVDLKGVTWVTASTSSGSGNGTVTLTLAANATGTADRKNRSATISIAGQNYTISQTWD
jgi:hypothetical protein